MKKFKITLLVFYIIMVVILIYESAIPESLSVKEHSFFKKVVNNVSRLFVKTKYVNAEEIVINNTLKESYYINDTLTLDVSIKPDNASYKELEFTSTNTNILTVDNKGYIEFLNIGNASVVIKQKDSNIEKTIDFSVTQKTEPVIEVVEPIEIDIDIEKTTMNMGELIDIKVYLLASDPNKKVTDKTVVFTSTNKHVATVFDGFLYALNAGTTTITATHKTTGIHKDIDITILEHELVKPNLEDFKIKGDNVIYLNDKTIHTYSVELDSNVSDIYKKVYFSSYYYDNVEKHSKDELKPNLVVNWRNGTATAIEAGYTVVYAYIIDVENECWSEYTSGMVVTTVNTLPKFGLKDRRIVLGDPYKLEIKPTNANLVTYDKYEYASSDESIASIDNLGNITPHKKGKVEIIVSVNDGYQSVEEKFILTVDSKVMEDNMGRKSFSKFVRKGLSHFMGFVVFGLISSFMFLLFIYANYDGNKKLNIVVTIVNGLVFACLTEFIQLFAIDRTSQFKDIAIDFMGYMLAVLIAFTIITITLLIKKKRRKNDKTIDDINNENI